MGTMEARRRHPEELNLKSSATLLGFNSGSSPPGLPFRILQCVDSLEVRGMLFWTLKYQPLQESGHTAFQIVLIFQAQFLKQEDTVVQYNKFTSKKIRSFYEYAFYSPASRHVVAKLCDYDVTHASANIMQYCRCV